MIITCFFLICLASFSQAYVIETTPYCSMKQYTVTQVGIQSNSGSVVVRGRHRALSALDYVNERYYTNYTLSVLDSTGKTLTIGYELIVDVPNGANYVIQSGECRKYRLPEQLQSSFTPCLNGMMIAESTSYNLGGFKGSPNAIREETFKMNLDVTDGENEGMTGQLWLSYAKNPDDPETYLLLKEEMLGSLQLSESSELISFSSEYVDYEIGVDEKRFNIPQDCPEEFDEGNFNGHNRYRRSLSTKSFQAARYAALKLLTP
ncbi:uncharacterized protein [Diadema antillarum]|uniref:uncharacterized protein n=1 Tax=Diadema antillarum TaxID=105358 RepID=UPI003A8B46C8